MDDGFFGGRASRVTQFGDVDPVGPFLRRAFLEDGLLLDAFDESLQDHRTIGHPAQGTVGDGQVVPDQVQFGVAGSPVLTGEDHLVRMGDCDLSSAHLQ